MPVELHWGVFFFSTPPSPIFKIMLYTFYVGFPQEMGNIWGGGEIVAICESAGAEPQVCGGRLYTHFLILLHETVVKRFTGAEVKMWDGDKSLIVPQTINQISKSFILFYIAGCLFLYCILFFLLFFLDSMKLPYDCLSAGQYHTKYSNMDHTDLSLAAV